MPEKKKHKLGAVKKDGEPVLGMKFEQSREKLLKFKSSRQNPYLKESLIGQVEKHEGVEAGADLREEINFKYDEETRAKKVDFIHNRNGKLMAAGIDFGKPKTYTWCPDCMERCYVYAVIKGKDGVSISRCSRCGTECIDITEEELKLKQEEGNG